MATCYRIPYRDRFGEHVATKWGETPQEAAAALKKARDIPGAGIAECGVPQPMQPQPFSEAARLARSTAV